MSYRPIDRKITTRMPRNVLVALLGRAERGEGQPPEASEGEASRNDRAPIAADARDGDEAVVDVPTIVPPPPTIVHHASIEAWLASKR